MNDKIECKNRADFYLKKELEHLGIIFTPTKEYYIDKEKTLVAPIRPRGIIYEYADNNGVVRDRDYSFEEIQRILPYEDKEC